eukprot:4924493-Lingulodinium_polyedra.AAC.1
MFRRRAPAPSCGIARPVRLALRDLRSCVGLVGIAAGLRAFVVRLFQRAQKGASPFLQKSRDRG